jgi:EAL domain-containing protein (putative c-di-GMP-specific phosphodiesterase class I)
MTSEPRLVLAGKPVLEYQPAVDLATGRLLGFEALVRWDHPVRGRIAPASLFPWVEASGDIGEVNNWVVTEACRQAQRWPSGIQLAINCSQEQVRQGEASIATAKAIDVSGLNPDRLTIEVSERTVADPDAAHDLRALSALGVHLAVDDVGTSWSTFEPLRRFAVETVKIDGRFISGLEPTEGMNRAMVEAVIQLCHSLSMSTVAEGVESAQQVAILREFAADVGQGYFFSHPLAEQEAEVLANTEPRVVFALTASNGTTPPPANPEPLPFSAPRRGTEPRRGAETRHASTKSRVGGSA